MPDIERVVLVLALEVDVGVDVVLDPVKLGLMASFRFEVARRWCSQIITVFGAVGSCCCCWTSTPLFDSSALVLGAEPVVVDSMSCFSPDKSVSLSLNLHPKEYHRMIGDQQHSSTSTAKAHRNKGGQGATLTT